MMDEKVSEILLIQIFESTIEEIFSVSTCMKKGTGLITTGIKYIELRNMFKCRRGIND